MITDDMLYGSAIGALIATVVVALGAWIMSRVHGAIQRRSLAVAALVTFILGAISLVIAHLIVLDVTNWWVNKDVPHDGPLLHSWVHPGATWTLLAYVSGLVLTNWYLRATQRSKGDPTKGAV